MARPLHHWWGMGAGIGTMRPYYLDHLLRLPEYLCTLQLEVWFQWKTCQRAILWWYLCNLRSSWQSNLPVHVKNPSYLDLDTEKQNVPLFTQSPENWLPTLPHLVSTVSCWVWALWQLKVMSESHVALSGWCWRQDSCRETKELPPWRQISKTWKEYFYHKIHTNSLSNKTPEHAHVSETCHLLTLALNLPVQVQKIKTSLMKHCWLVHELFQLCYWDGFLEGKWEWSIFFLISAQACLFCRRPGVLPRRQISKSSMPIMNKSFTYLKEWNLFSVVWMESTR